jgi:ubiquinone/menaquinone biosynthesis C-methylase UbiE
MEPARIIPALRFDALTRLFDPVVRVTTRERLFKRLLVEQVNLQPGHRVVDVGCGTATLAIQLKQSCAAARVVGLDADENVLEIARTKVRAEHVDIELHQGMAWEIPVEVGSLDRAVSSLVFHHLDRDAKVRTLRAMHRALRRGGELHIADWGQAHGLGMRLAFVAVQLLDGFATTADSVAGRLPGLIETAGFDDVCETRRLRTPLGTISLYRARR